MKQCTYFPLARKYKGHHPIRTLAMLFRPEVRNLVRAFIFGVIKHIPVFVMPVIVGSIITILTHPGPESLRQVLQYAAILAVILVQNIPMNFLRVRYLSRALRNVEALLRSSLVRRLQQLSISFHDSFESGRLHSKILRDADLTINLARMFFENVALTVVTMAVAVSITIAKEPLVALFFLVAVPLAVMLVRVFRKRVRESNRQLRYSIEAMSALVSEIVSLVPIARAHALENKEIHRMDHQVNHVKEKGYRVDMINALFHASIWVTFQFAQFSCLLFTGYLAIKGRIPVGDVVMYQAFFSQVVGGVNMILSLYPQIARGFESIRSMGEILECPDLEENEGKERVTGVEGDFAFRNVSLLYPDTYRPAVDNFNFTVKPGECVAFVGESGSGKTSIMSLIMGFHRPSAGRILLDGKDMTGLDLRTFRHYLAVVPQETILFSGTLRDNITYGLDRVSDEKLNDIMERANLKDVVEKLPYRLETLIGENGAKLSGGQRQRVAIARALIRDPRVIILDEATSALDVASEREVQKAIDELIKGRTTFIVAHRLSTIRNADRIVVLEEGHQVETGTREELLARKGEFHRYATLQSALV